jgi:hypothetical protein
MLMIFFDIRGISIVEYVSFFNIRRTEPQNQMENQHFYIQILTQLRGRTWKKRLDLWSHGWILHQDNALAHEVILVCLVLPGKQIPTHKHVVYQPDFAV